MERKKPVGFFHLHGPYAHPIKASSAWWSMTRARSLEVVLLPDQVVVLLPDTSISQ